MWIPRPTPTSGSTSPNLGNYLRRMQFGSRSLSIYFDYEYAGPGKEEQHPFAAHTEVAGCPWNDDHRLVRIVLKGRQVAADKRPLSNLVFLVDVSGSMNEPNKLPLVVEGLSYMTNELGENDRVAIVVYAGSEGLALSSTRGDNQDAILAALQQLSAAGSTAGGAGIKLAYQVAEKHFIKGDSNRVILCTDGDFNVGLTSQADLERRSNRFENWRVRLWVTTFVVIELSFVGWSKQRANLSSSGFQPPQNALHQSASLPSHPRT